MKKTILTISISFLLIMPLFVLANGEDYKPLVPCVMGECDLCDFFVLINNIIKFVMIDLVPPLAVFMLLVGGVMYFMGGMSPNMIAKGKETFKAVAIGLLIVYTAWIVVDTILARSGVVEKTGTAWWRIECETSGAGNGIDPGDENGSGNGEEGENGEEEEKEVGITCPENLESHPDLGDDYLKVRLFRTKEGIYPTDKRCPSEYVETQLQKCTGTSIPDNCDLEDYPEYEYEDTICCMRIGDLNDIPDDTLLGHKQAIGFLENNNIDVELPCTDENCGGDSNFFSCTCLEGIPAGTIKELIDIKEVSGEYVKVTGGTEGGHQTHGPGISILDLKSTNNEDFNNWIREYGYEIPLTEEESNYFQEAYLIDANDSEAEFYFETNHWHVIF